jgi:hypothetical protein
MEKTFTKRIGVVIAASALVIGITGRTQAEIITSLSSSGPGGTTPLLAVNPLQKNSIEYIANFTSVAPITITVGVDGPGVYEFGHTINANETGIIANSTGSLWTAFDIALIGAPSGSMVNGAGFKVGDPLPFVSIDIIRTNVHYYGPPPLPSGATFQPGVEYFIGGTGPQAFSIQLTPEPEPPSAVLLTLGLVGVAGLMWCRTRAEGLKPPGVR